MTDVTQKRDIHRVETNGGETYTLRGIYKIGTIWKREKKHIQKKEIHGVGMYAEWEYIWGEIDSKENTRNGSYIEKKKRVDA